MKGANNMSTANSLLVKWLHNEATEINSRTKNLISPSDKDLVMSKLTRYADIDEYEKAFDDAGMNWHSGGPIIGAKIQFADFSEESKKQIKRKFYDHIEYIMEYNAFDETSSPTYPVPQFGIKETDNAFIEYDDEWGLFIKLCRDGEKYSYASLKADDDPVLESLWNIDRHGLPLGNDETKY